MIQNKVRLAKLQIGEHKKEIEELDMNPELELLKMKKEEVKKIQFQPRKEKLEQEIDDNIKKIDQVKRQWKDCKRKIQAIKRWKQSNKQITELRMKDNEKHISEI